MLQPLPGGRCTCANRGPAGQHSERCPTLYFDKGRELQALKREEDMLNRRIQQAECIAQAEADKRKEAQENRILAGSVKGQLQSHLLQVLSQGSRGEKLEPIGYQLWGKQVFRFQGSELSRFDLPLHDHREQRAWIFSELARWGCSADRFFCLLREQNMVMNYALQEAEAESNKGQLKRKAAQLSTDALKPALTDGRTPAAFKLHLKRVVSNQLKIPAAKQKAIEQPPKVQPPTVLPLTEQPSREQPTKKQLGSQPAKPANNEWQLGPAGKQ